VHCIALDLGINVNDFRAPFTRYLSLIHLSNKNDSDALVRAQQAMAKAINSIHFRRRLVKPVQVDKYGLVYRIDLRDFQISRIDDWNKILAAYPYAINYFDKGLFEGQERFINSRAQTQLAFINSDFFVELITRPPFYNDLLGLPNTSQELLAFLEINEAEQVAEEELKRWGIRSGQSEVSFFNRMLEKLEIDDFLGGAVSGGFFWQSFDFGSDVNRSNIFINPFRFLDLNFLQTDKIFIPDAQEYIWTLPNGLQAYYLANAVGDLLEVGDPAVVFDNRNRYPVLGNPLVQGKQPQAGTITMGISCMGCHAVGMRTSFDQVYPTIEGSFNFNNIEVDYAKDIFATDAELSEYFQIHNQTFQRSLGDIGITDADALNPNKEPVYYSAKDFLDDMSVTEFGGELYLNSAEVRSKLIAAVALARKLGLANLQTGKVQRRVFDDNFERILKDFNLGVRVDFSSLIGGGNDP